MLFDHLEANRSRAILSVWCQGRVLQPTVFTDTKEMLSGCLLCKASFVTVLILKLKFKEKKQNISNVSVTTLSKPITRIL